MTLRLAIKVVNSNLKRLLNFINIRINLSAEGQSNEIHTGLAIHNTYAGFV